MKISYKPRLSGLCAIEGTKDGANDVILVLLALLLSYCVFHEIRGLREGTVISALCVGIFVKFWLAGLTKLFKRAPADTE